MNELFGEDGFEEMAARVPARRGSLALLSRQPSFAVAFRPEDFFPPCEDSLTLSSSHFDPQQTSRLASGRLPGRKQYRLERYCGRVASKLPAIRLHEGGDDLFYQRGKRGNVRFGPKSGKLRAEHMASAPHPKPDVLPLQKTALTLFARQAI